MKKIPFFAIGNDELDEKPLAGKSVKCKVCGKRHKLKTSSTLGFYTCDQKIYLAAIEGKLI